MIGMKKVLCAMIVLVMCLAMAVPAFAADFVPSISYKDAPTVTGPNADSISITSIQDALNNPDAYKELLELYNQLMEDPSQLGVDGDVTITDMFNIDGVDGETEVTLQLNNVPNGDVMVKQFVDGQWIDIPVTVNPDGTITCIFANNGPVVILFAAGGSVAPETGDFMAKNMGLWIVVMAAAAVALVAVVANRRKIFG